MASGAPDWYSQTYVDIVAQTLATLEVDIILQSLSEVINRPKYGGAELLTSSTACGAGATTSLGSVAGRGVIYGGSIIADDVTTHKDDSVIIVLDSEDIDSLALDNALLYSINKPTSSLVYLLHYDDVNFIYTFGISPNITFEDSFEIKWKNTYADPITIALGLYYATI